MSDDLATLSVSVSGRDVGLTRLLRQVERELRASDAAAQRTQNETIQLSAAYARLASAMGQPAAGAAQLRSTLESLTNVESRQAVALQTQIVRLEQQAQKLREVGAAGGQTVGALGRVQQGVSGLNSVLGAAGIAVGVQQIVSFGQESITLANRTNDAKRALEALAGSPRLYAEALAVARTQQGLFGGSLEENISGIQGLITVSRSSGVELQKLIDITQRLSIKDPAQGVSGARIALNEALAGDPTSLAKRYEIPRAALAKIRDESVTAGEKLAILDQYLSDIGITSEVASGAVGQNTIAFNQLQAGAERAQIALGNLIATEVAPWAQGFSGVLNTVAEGLDNFSRIGQQQNQINGALVTGATSYQAYQTALTNTNGQITAQTTLVEGMVARLPELTQLQFQLAQSLVAQGASGDAAVASVQQYAGALNALAPASQAYVASLVAQGTSLQQAIAAAQPLGRVLTDIASVQRDLVDSGTASATVAAQLGQRLTALAAVGGPVAATTAALVRGYRDGSISAAQLQAALAQLEVAQSRVVSITQANGAALAAMAGAQRTATAAVSEQNQAIGQQLTAQAAATEQANLLAQANREIASLGSAVASGLTTMGAAANQLAAQYGIAESAARALIAAQAQIATQATFASQRDAREQRNAGAGPQQASAGALRFVEEQQAAARAAQEARARANRATGGGGGGGGGTSQAERQLQAQQDLEQRSIEQARDYEAERTQIAEDGARERAEAERRFAQQQRGDRADFYLGLADIEDNAVRQGLAAKFEAANAEAARIAAEQGADAAAEYLTAAQQAIESESAIEQKIAEALAKGDTGTAEYLQGVLKLRQEANAAELQAIRDKGSALAAEQAQQYAAAEAQYAEHLAKLDAMAKEKGVTLGQTLLPNATTTGAAAAGATGAGAVTPATGTTAAAGQVQPVEDVATPGAIDAQTGRLEARLNALIAVAESAVREISSLRGAIEGLKRSGATASG